ncbi:hypothetical protein HQQ80_20690 [Microbacteriaceae bacterium VKM Ac-2855]|nr:hypothetical protein [Microbacteriaceae bacterium VKM Ac-2855]
MPTPARSAETPRTYGSWRRPQIAALAKTRSGLWNQFTAVAGQVASGDAFVIGQIARNLIPFGTGAKLGERAEGVVTARRRHADAVMTMGGTRGLPPGAPCFPRLPRQRGDLVRDRGDALVDDTGRTRPDQVHLQRGINVGQSLRTWQPRVTRHLSADV